jgi:hypothetical protein
MRWDYLLATIPQTVSMYFILCVMGNWLSMLAPMPIASGSLKPRNPKLTPVLIQMAFVFMLPLIMAPLLVPLGLELLLQYAVGIEGIPVYLGLSIIACAVVIYLYQLFLTLQGSFLQVRELRILEIVTTKAE